MFPPPPGGGGGAGARERGARKFFILFIIIKLEAAGVTKDYFGGILSSNDIYIYIKTVKKNEIGCMCNSLGCNPF